MAKREETEFGEYMMAPAVPVPVYGSWPEAAKLRPPRPSAIVAAGGLVFGLALGFLATWPSSTLVYPGTQVAAWMGTPDAVLQGTGQPVVLQATGQPYATQPTTALQNTRNTQLTSFSQSQQGYLDQVGGRWLQGTANIAAVQ